MVILLTCSLRSNRSDFVDNPITLQPHNPQVLKLEKLEFIKNMNPKLLTVILLIISNVFMTIAWYGHLKLQTSGVSSSWPLYAVILLSWGVALVEYCFMIPANRIGFAGNGGPFTLMQLKVLQEVITLVVFTILAMFFFSGEKLHWNHVAAFICLVAAVYFVFMPTGK